jgi:hypothetical protein
MLVVLSSFRIGGAEGRCGAEEPSDSADPNAFARSSTEDTLEGGAGLDSDDTLSELDFADTGFAPLFTGGGGPVLAGVTGAPSSEDLGRLETLDEPA